MEYASAFTTRVHLPQHIRYPKRQILSLPSLPYPWRFLQWASPPLGYTLENTLASAEDTPHRCFNRRPHPSCLLDISSRHSERQQHHLLFNGRHRMRMDCRHAKSTPRIPRTHHPASQQNRRPQSNMHVLPHLRSHILPRRHRGRHDLPLPSLRPRRCQSRRRHPNAI